MKLNKIHYIGLILSITLILMFALIFKHNKASHVTDEANYHQSMDNLIKITKKDLLNYNSEANTLIFLGSEECPYCIDYLDSINAIIKSNQKKGLVIQYYPVDLTIDYNDLEFVQFMEKHHLESIPSFIVIAENKIETITSKDIENYTLN